MFGDVKTLKHPHTKKQISPPLKEPYSSQITSCSPQGMRVLRQCKDPRAGVMFVTIQRENIRPSKKEISEAWQLGYE
jgi:hypothetical protein